jgi:hypothetical protein
VIVAQAPVPVSVAAVPPETNGTESVKAVGDRAIDTASELTAVPDDPAAEVSH